VRQKEEAVIGVMPEFQIADFRLQIFQLTPKRSERKI